MMNNITRIGHKVHLRGKALNFIFFALVSFI